MTRTAILAALLCAVCSPVVACDAMRPCYGDGRPLFASHVDFPDQHVGRKNRHGMISAGLRRVMADGAGRAIDWARPRAWCGWFMRRRHHVANPAANRAAWWATYGRHATGPAIGTIVVWAHHVGEIVGRTAQGAWIVLSGNDGHRVRERPRSVAGAIAFRWPA